MFNLIARRIDANRTDDRRNRWASSGSGDRRFESFLASQLLAEPQDVVVGPNEGPAYRA
jgi:hypothetical protein